MQRLQRLAPLQPLQQLSQADSSGEADRGVVAPRSLARELLRVRVGVRG